MENDQLLLQRLDQFIRRYYKNQLIRGGFVLTAITGILFLAPVLMEYFFRFSNGVRLFFFYAFVGIFLVSVVFLVIIPLLKLLRIGKILSYDEAARIIGNHFPEISDKLLNTLQLMRHRQDTGENIPLLVAGIDQKIRLIKPFRFNIVINLKNNLRYLKFALPPVLLILAVLIIVPSVISEPAKRIVHYNTTFVPDLPYRLVILNKSLEAMQKEDFELRILLEGEEIPQEVFIENEGVTYRMTPQKGTQFSYVFKSLQNDKKFRINAGDLRTAEYQLKVFPKPIILGLDIALDYPAYIRKMPEKVENTGDLSIPEGTTVKWRILTKDADRIIMNLGGSLKNLEKPASGDILYNQRFTESTNYSLTPVNRYSKNEDSLGYRINVVKDGYPSIYVQESLDSAITTSMFFRGTIKDDYGFTKLTFNYKVTPPGDTTIVVEKSLPVVIDNLLNSQVFYFNTDLSGLVTTQGDEIRYYFEIWDNDGINGPKATRSEIRIMKTPTLEDLQKLTDESQKNILDDLKGSLTESKEARKKMDELSKRMVEQNSVNWQEKKKVSDIIKANEKIVNSIEEIKKQNQQNIDREEKYFEMNKDILEKQRRLNELMNEVMTDEMKKTLQEMKDMLDKIDKNKLNDMLEKMKMTNKDLEEQLDRNLALFKQLEFERKLDETVNDLKKQAEKQDELAEKVEKKTTTPEDALKEQKEINEKFDSIRSSLDDLKEKEKELENPPGLGKTEQKQDSISENLKESKEMLEKSKPANAGKKQKDASKQMKDLAQELETMAQEAEMEQMEADAEGIRAVLESLLRMSFEQEQLIGDATTINRNDPKFLLVISRQKEVKDKLQSAEDSLIKISKTQFMLAPIVNREIASINRNIEEVVTSLNNRNMPQALAKQQFAMTSINNLALLLDESLKQMNQNMKMSMSGKGMKLCKNPTSAGGNMKMKSMRQMQEQMSQQLSRIKEGMEKGESGQGKNSKGGQGSMSEEIARLAAEQEAIRNELSKYKEQLDEEGVKDGGNMSNAMNEMEQNEKDLVNKRITQETIMRQQRIITRMLESEKAEQTREKEEKRESREEKNQKYRNFTGDFEYKKLQSGKNEFIQYQAPPVNWYYRNRINSYMIKIGQ